MSSSSRRSRSTAVHMNDGDNSIAASAVLSDSTLVSRLTDFQTGYPQAIATLARSATREQLEAARQVVYFAGGTRFSRSQEGVLPRLVVAVGDTRTLELLYDLRTKSSPYQKDQQLKFLDVMALAVRLERVDMLECLVGLMARDPGWQWEPNLISIALDGEGDIRVLEWLYCHLPPEERVLRADHIESAVTRGHLKSVRWLVEHGCPVSESAADRAAFSANAEVLLAYLYEHTSARLHLGTLNHVARDGRLEIVKIAAPGHSWYGIDHAMAAAASDGQLEVVRYLLENTIGVTGVKAFNGAAYRGHFSIILCLLEHTPGGCTSDAMDLAAAGGHIAIVKFLHENRTEGCTKRAMNGAAAHGHLDVVKFLHENRSEGCSTEAMNEAATRGHLDVVKFLHEHRTEGCTTDAMNEAAARGYLEIVKFLYENRSEVLTSRALQRVVGVRHLSARQLEVADYLYAHLSERDVGDAMTLVAASNGVEAVKILLRYPKAQAYAYAAVKAAAQKRRSTTVKFLCLENQSQRELGASSTSFILQAVEEGAERLVMAVLPFASLADVEEARARSVVMEARDHDVELRILLALENRLQELSSVATRKRRRTRA